LKNSEYDSMMCLLSLTNDKNMGHGWFSIWESPVGSYRDSLLNASLWFYEDSIWNGMVCNRFTFWNPLWVKFMSDNAKYYCCRRQHTILKMKYCVNVCPVSLAELCILAERQLDFCMYGCTDDRFLTSEKF
jgi:hypothetical protein